MTQLRRKLHIFGIGCLVVSLSMNAVFFLGFGLGTFKVRKTVSTEIIKYILGPEVETELVFDRFAVATEKNKKTTPAFVIADTRFEDMLFVGGSFDKGQQYHISINVGKEFAQTFVVTTTDTPEVREAWHTYNDKTRKDLNVDGSADTLINLEEKNVYIKVNDNWLPVKSRQGSKFKKHTIDGRTYRFEHSSGKWVPTSSTASDTE